MGVDCYILNETVKNQVAGGPCEANDFTRYFDGVVQELQPIRRADDSNGNKRFIVNKVTFDANAAFAAAQPYVSGCPVLNSSHPDFPDLYEPPEE